MSTNHLLVIDPQNDFCDLPAAWCAPDPLTGQPVAPALPVPGAHADLQRLAAFVRAVSPQLDDITVTLDSHHRVHIAHPTFWQAAQGGAVAPFTPITARDVREGRFHTRDAADAARALAYLDALEARGRYPLMVWPVHCEIGSWGHAVHADLRAAYNGWEEQGVRQVRKVTKGANRWTEHYSALQAEVPDPADPRTQLDRELLAALDRADRIIVAGEAGSHCVKATVEDLVDHLPGGRPDRLVLLTDAMSPVAGFAAAQADFLRRMAERGVRLARCADVQAELNAPRRAD